MTVVQETEKKQDHDTAWAGGIEGMLAASPTTTFRTAPEVDRLDAYLEGLLEDGGPGAQPERGDVPEIQPGHSARAQEPSVGHDRGTVGRMIPYHPLHRRPFRLGRNVRLSRPPERLRSRGFRA